MYGLLNGMIVNDLQCPWRSFRYCKPFQVRFLYLWCVTQPLCICRASCLY